MSLALIVMAKAPVPGLAKTRLVAALGAEGAAQLAHRLLMHTLRQAAGLQAAHWGLCVTPTTEHPSFAQALALGEGRLVLSMQGQGDLGCRMQRALARVLQTHDKALLLGTDIPAMSTDLLQRAAAALDRYDAVFVPAMDGGYALVGLRQVVPALFEGMVWSTAEVMAETRVRARQAAIRWLELPPVHDIDEPADLVHLPASWWTGSA